MKETTPDHNPISLRDAIIPHTKKTEMKKEFDYLVKNENCKEALKELMFYANHVKWLSEYSGSVGATIFINYLKNIFKNLNLKVSNCMDFF